jgi:LmbE family N-acetylglucosaminyl deacetylase
MTEQLKLLAIFPHPDDESLGMGGTLAKYAAEGVEVYLACLTRGERGWPGPKEANPGQEALGRLREAELRCAAQTLGLKEVTFLDYLDGDVDQANPGEAIGRIVAEIRRVRPQVVVTFGPEGVYGHPDHIAASQFTHAAAVRAADSGYVDSKNQLPHQISKLYYMIDTQALVDLLAQVLDGIRFNVDGVVRSHFGYPDWLVTTRVDASQYWRTAWQAILCHQSQLPGLKGLLGMSETLRAQVWGEGNFYRAFSLVNAGRERENDLFAGLR